MMTSRVSEDEVGFDSNVSSVPSTERKARSPASRKDGADRVVIMFPSLSITTNPEHPSCIGKAGIPPGITVALMQDPVKLLKYCATALPSTETHKKLTKLPYRAHH
mmetsp:Transcript_13020/g.14653  ORF Transcript_13020/g.14653 Transcript_13020/m.14653 type:complete len:106 (+) Transcript_13020:112-429(+)